MAIKPLGTFIRALNSGSECVFDRDFNIALMDEPKFDAYSLPELGACINVPTDSSLPYSNEVNFYH